MLFYSFFDYKHNIEGFDSDLFSTPHIIYIAAVYALGVTLSILFRSAKRERITAALRFLSIAAVVFEVSKISWESYYDVTTGHGFNYGGILPLYTCSLFIYTLLGAAWGRGKVREYCLSFISTIGLLYGAIGVIYCNGLNFYPFWTFGAFYSLFFHSAMFITGIYLLISGYKKLECADCLRAFVPIVLLALLAVPFNYIYNHRFNSNADYMLLYSGDGVPVYQDISSRLGERGLRFLYTLLMLATHIPLAGIVVGAYKLISALIMPKRKSESALAK